MEGASAASLCPVPYFRAEVSVSLALSCSSDLFCSALALLRAGGTWAEMKACAGESANQQRHGNRPRCLKNIVLAISAPVVDIAIGMSQSTIRTEKRTACRRDDLENHTLVWLLKKISRGSASRFGRNSSKSVRAAWGSSGRDGGPKRTDWKAKSTVQATSLQSESLSGEVLPEGSILYMRIGSPCQNPK